MSNFDKNRFASVNQCGSTPKDLFDVLNQEFHFTLDVCADETNYKIANYFTEDNNALTQEWNGICWMNPPYKDMKKWIIKAYNESRKENTVVVCLIPSRTNTIWWHEYCMKGEIRFIKGRPKFEGYQHGLPQPLAIVVFGINYHGKYKSVIF